MAEIANSKTDSSGRPITWITGDDFPAIRRAANDPSISVERQERDRAIVDLLRDTGLRPCEVVGLDVAHLELEGDTPHIRLPGEIQKDYPTERSPEEAFVTLDPETADSLRGYLNRRAYDDTEAVFSSRQSPRVTTQTLRNVVSQLAEIADTRPRIKGESGRGDPSDVTPYTFRHSVAHKILVEEGGVLEDVTRRLRHTRVQTTMDYYEMFIPR